MSNKRLGARLRLDPCEPWPRLHQNEPDRAPTRRLTDFTDLTFSRPYLLLCVMGGREMTEVRIKRCVVLVPPPLASSFHEWDRTTRIARGPNAEKPATYRL